MGGYAYRCTSCGASNVLSDETVLLNAAVPEQRQQALTLEGLLPVCTNCGDPLLCINRILYLDEDHAFAVHYAPPWNQDSVPEGSPEFTRRRTNALLAFREKVFLLDHGIEDEVLELLKLFTRKGNPDIRFDVIYCSDVLPDHFEMRALCANEKDFSYNIPREAYDNLRSRLESLGPSSWHPRGFALVDEEWAERTMEWLSRKAAEAGGAPDQEK